MGERPYSSLPARCSIETSDCLYDEGAPVPIKYAVIDHAGSGDNTLVAAVAGKKIRVLSYVFVVTGAVNVRFESGAGGTALTGVMNFDAAGKGISASYSPKGHFQTAAAALLNLELSGAVSVDGHLTYIEAT